MLTVYSKNNCPHCDNAKDYLRRCGIEFQEINIEQDHEARAFIVDQGLRTVPQIFQDQRILIPGGWQALSRMTTQDIRAAMEQSQTTQLGTL